MSYNNDYNNDYNNGYNNGSNNGYNNYNNQYNYQDNNQYNYQYNNQYQYNNAGYDYNNGYNNGYNAGYGSSAKIISSEMYNLIIGGVRLHYQCDHDCRLRRFHRQLCINESDCFLYRLLHSRHRWYIYGS